MKRSNNAESVRQTIIEAAREASKLITDASELQIKAIADAAGQARTVVTATASEAARIVSAKSIDSGSDHDLLQRLDGKVDALGAAIKDIKEGTSTRIDRLESGKINVSDSYPILYKAGVDKSFSDHEDRIRDNEVKTNKMWAYGAVGVLAVQVVGFLIARFYK